MTRTAGSGLPERNGNIQPLFAASEIERRRQASRYSNPEVDAAIDAAIAEPDLDKAAAMWAAIDKQIMKDAPVVPILRAAHAGPGRFEDPELLHPRLPAVRE